MASSSFMAIMHFVKSDFSLVIFLCAALWKSIDGAIWSQILGIATTNIVPSNSKFALF